MGEFHVIRIGKSNFAQFSALVRAGSEEGCDLFPPPAPDAVIAFLKSQPAPARLASHGLPVSGGQWIAPANMPKATLPSPQAENGRMLSRSQAERHREFTEKLWATLRVEEKKPGELFVEMQAPQDAAALQTAIFYRAAPDQPYAIAHCFAMPAADYVEALIAHPPVAGEALLSAEAWPDGTRTLTRKFMFSGKIFALPLYTLSPQGKVTAGHLPEEAYLSLAQDINDYRKALALRHGGLPKIYAPEDKAWATLAFRQRLANAPGRPSIIKYATEATRNAIQGAYYRAEEWVPRATHYAFEQKMNDAGQDLTSPVLFPLSSPHLEEILKKLQAIKAGDVTALADLRRLALAGPHLAAQKTAAHRSVFYPVAPEEALDDAARQALLGQSFILTEEGKNAPQLLSCPARPPTVFDASRGYALWLSGAVLIARQAKDGSWQWQSIPEGRVRADFRLADFRLEEMPPAENLRPASMARAAGAKAPPAKALQI